jgi:hypothetical protein
MTTLFNASDAVESVKERKATKSESAARAYANSPHFQRLVEENKQLRSVVRRISALESRTSDLESRADVQEQWNAECETYVKDKAVPAWNWQCTGCLRSLPANAGNFPNMGREKAMKLGADRVCCECLNG